MDNLTLIAILSVSVGSLAALLGFVASRTLAHKPEAASILRINRIEASSAAQTANSNLYPSSREQQTSALQVSSGNATASFGSIRSEQAGAGKAIGAKA